MMKRFLLFPALMLALAFSCEKPASGGTDSTDEDVAVAETLNIATFNIRYATSEDTGVKSWASRKESCFASVKDNDFDVVGFQEVLAKQQADLKEGLTD